MEVRQAEAAATYPLRLQILRPHQSLDEMAWPGDDHPEAIHLLAEEADEVIGMVSFFPLPRPSSPALKSFRLRGMGVVDERRGAGVGAALLDRGVGFVEAGGGDEIWCHARRHAATFYERHGFVTVGDYWEEPVIGPHIVMFRPL